VQGASPLRGGFTTTPHFHPSESRYKLKNLEIQAKFYTMAKNAKGKRPIYLGEPQTDKLLGIVMAMAGEVSVIRERLDTLERLLQEKEIMSLAEIEAYQPNAQTTQEREQWRIDYLARLLRMVEAEVEALK
jgi:hypothetical protein